MQEMMRNYLDGVMAGHKKYHRIVLFLLVLSVFVGLSVFWRLKITGVAMTDEAVCGHTEHTHTEECYERQLVCGLAESEIPHTHSVELGCYEVTETLTCTAEEHTHGEDCYVYETVLDCGCEEHTHSEECYDADGNLICELEEHTHSDDCYTEVATLVCGLEEHTHSDGCYTTEVGELICQMEEGATHTHTEECYGDVLVCDLEEHTHTTDCYCDTTADLESGSDWEATLPDTTGVWADDMVAIANSQLGYAESTRNFQLDGSEERGYTRYGEWYGNPYGSWDAMFVSFCMYYSDITSADIPYGAGAYAWSVALQNAGLWADASHTPEPGDVVFLDTDDTTAGPDTVGVVTAVSGDTMTVVAGDYNNIVAQLTGSASSDAVYGYCPVASLQSSREGTEGDSYVYTESAKEETTSKIVFMTEDDSLITTEEEEEVVTDAEETEEASGEIDETASEETETVEETAVVEEPVTYAHCQNAETENYYVTVYYNDDAQIPEDAVLTATEYAEDSEEFQACVEEAGYLLDWVMDIGFYQDGEKVEPVTSVRVVVTSRDGSSVGETITHFAESGTEVLTGTENDGAVTFVTNSFSSFAASKVLNSIAESISNLYGGSNGTNAVADGDQGSEEIEAGESATFSNVGNHTWIVFDADGNQITDGTISASATSSGSGRNQTYTLTVTTTTSAAAGTYYIGYDSSDWWSSSTTYKKPYKVIVTASSSGGDTDTDTTDDEKNTIIFWHQQQNDETFANDEYYPAANSTNWSNTGTVVYHKRNVVQFMVLLADEDGNIGTTTDGVLDANTDLPTGSYVPDYFVFDVDEKGVLEITADTFAGISVPGYSYSSSYAYFGWGSNNDTVMNQVYSFHNFGTYAIENASFTSEEWTNRSYSYIGYHSDLNISGGSGTCGTKDSGDDKYNYWYQTTGIFMIVLSPVSQDVTYETNWHNDYVPGGTATTNIVDVTKASMYLDETVNPKVWRGYATGTTTYQDGTALTAPADGYEFVGWYTEKDSEGNGTGKQVTFATDGTVYVLVDGEKVILNQNNDYYARWEKKSDTAQIRVEKTFKYLTSSSVPSDFTITVGSVTKTLTEATETTTTNEGYPVYTWTFDAESDGTYNVTESNMGTTYAKQITVNGGTAVIKEKTVADYTASNVTAQPVSEDKLTTSLTPLSSIETDNTIGSAKMIVATGTDGKTLIWTDSQLYANQRTALLNNLGLTESSVSFYSGAAAIAAGLNYNGTVTYDGSNTLTFSDASKWSSVQYGTWKDTSGTCEIEITNAYVELVKVDFFLNLASQNLDGTTVTQQNRDSFTRSVAGHYTNDSNDNAGQSMDGTNSPYDDLYVVEPAGWHDIENSSSTILHSQETWNFGTKSNGETITQYGAISGATDTANSLIRNLGTGQAGNGDYSKNYTFQIVDSSYQSAFPTDAQVFKYLAYNWDDDDWSKVNCGKKITVTYYTSSSDTTGVTITIKKGTMSDSEFETYLNNNFEIKWYVFKDDQSFWHVDGLLVAKTSTLTIQKTFPSVKVAQAALAKGYSVTLTGGVLKDANGDDVVLTYALESSDIKAGATGAVTYTLETNIPIFAGEYTVTENNYDGLTGYTYTSTTNDLTVDTGSVTHTDTGSTGYENTALTFTSTSDGTRKHYTASFTNNYETNIKLLKVASGGSALTGAEFTLEDNSSGKYLNSSGDWVEVTGNATPPVLTSTGSNGNILVGSLPDGIYTLTETKAPDGYNLLANSITITVSEGSIDATDGQTTGSVVSTQSDTGYAAFKISNNAGNELPHTGGTGVLPYTIAGLALMLTGLGGMAIRRRKRRAKG